MIQIKKFTTFCLALFFTANIFAAPMTPYPELVFEGAFDYFILGKSLLANTGVFGPEQYEPQGDTSLGVEGTTAILKNDDLPPDALVEKAFLIWFASVNDQDPAMLTDNEVTLVLPDGSEHTVTASMQGNSFAPATLEFDSYHKSGYYYYTYRVDITEILSNYQLSDAGAGTIPLEGNYSVKGVDDIWDCVKASNHKYCNSASMVGGWQILFIYGSHKIARKRLYLYHGVDWSSNTKLNPKPINVANFELPEMASVKVSFVTMDGDDVPSAPESLEMIGEFAQNNLILGEFGDGACNPLDQPFNSKHRTYNYKGEPSECIEELSFDIDTFFLQYDPDNTESFINPHIEYGTTWFNFFIKTGADIILTNYVMLSVDTRLPAFDIPDANEKFVFSQSDDSSKVCHDRPFYYEIRIENHGHEPAINVEVKDNIYVELKYVPGSTQIDRTGTGKCYEPVDDISGESPLTYGFKVADTLEICQDPDNCDSILVRFKVEPQNPPKHAMFSNTALIYDEKSGGHENAYRSNQGLPARTTVDFECDENIVELYTKESMSCDGAVDLEDPSKDEEKEDNGDSEESDKNDKESDNKEDSGSDNNLEDESACSCNIIF
jgi:uncharacterized repeat protein (TIGR01451 family)